MQGEPRLRDAAVGIQKNQCMDGRWDKNDTKDSANVADLMAQGKCQFFEIFDLPMVQVRNLLSLRRRLKRDEHALRMKIRNGLVTNYFPEFDRHWGSSLTENLAIVRWCLDPRKISSMGFEDFVRQVTRTDRGLRQHKRLKRIYEAAALSIGCPMDEAAEFEARLLVDRLEVIREQMESTETEIKQICLGFACYRRLLTIPGFCPYVASIVLARIGDLHRFKGRKQVIRLAGNDLHAKRSGKRSKDAVPVISKRGNSELRYAISFTPSCVNILILDQISKSSKISARIRGDTASESDVFFMKSKKKKRSLSWWPLLIEAVPTDFYNLEPGRDRVR